MTRQTLKPHKIGKLANPQIKLAVITLLVLALLVIGGRTIQFVRSIFQPVQSSIGVERTYTWDGTFNVNIVIRGDAISVLSYNPNEKKVTVIPIPEKTYVSVPGNFGEWEIRSIYELGESVQESSGNVLLKNTVAALLGIPFDGYIELGGELAYLSEKELVDKIRQQPISFMSSFSEIETDLSMVELIKLVWSISQVRFDKVAVLDLEKLAIINNDTLPDGSNVLGVDTIRLDSILENINESSLPSERLTVAVFNATNHPGLAQKAARRIKNMGGNVIIANNAEMQRDKTLVVPQIENAQDIMQSRTYKRLTQVFGSSCSKDLECDIIECMSSEKLADNVCQIKDPEVALSRAQINVIVGEDFAQQ